MIEEPLLLDLSPVFKDLKSRIKDHYLPTDSKRQRMYLSREYHVADIVYGLIDLSLLRVTYGRAGYTYLNYLTCHLESCTLEVDVMYLIGRIAVFEDEVINELIPSCRYRYAVDRQNCSVVIVANPPIIGFDDWLREQEESGYHHPEEITRALEGYKRYVNYRRQTAS